MANQLSQRRRVRLQRMGDRVDLTDQEPTIEELAEALDEHQSLSAQALRSTTKISHRCSCSSYGFERAALWVLVILVVGVVMADWAAIKDWAIGRFLEPPPLPPILAAYNYNAVVNWTLQQDEKNLAADITKPGQFGLERPIKQGDGLENALNNVSYNYLTLWGAIEETQNQTILRYYDQIKKYPETLYRGLSDMDREIKKTIFIASERLETTNKFLSRVLNLPSSEIVRIWGHPLKRFSEEEYWYRFRHNLTLDYDGDPELLRNETLWDEVCKFQAYIIGRNNRLLKHALWLREVLEDSKNKPAEEFMRKELVIRKDMARVFIEDIHQRYNTSMQKWGASLPNRWYDSSGVLMGVLGWYLDGQKPPTWPDSDLWDHCENMDNLERAQAKIIFAQAMMRSIEAHLVDSRILIGYADTRPGPADVDANYPCPLRLGNADNSTQPQSPYEMLLILEEHLAAFDKQINSWDEELFHSHVQQAWESMKGDLYQGG